MSGSEKHDSMAEPAIRFAQQAYHMTICLHEPSKQRLNSGGEVPDLICWDHYGRSLVVDFKRSSEDIRKHHEKPHVQHQPKGMGVWRVMLTEYGLSADTTPGWGWWTLNSEGEVIERLEPQPHYTANKTGELELLAQHAERLQKLVEPGQQSPGGKKRQQNPAKVIPRHCWTSIYNAVVDYGYLELDDAAAIVRANSSVPRYRIHDALRGECEGEGFAIDDTVGQFHNLVLAEQTQTQETS